MNWHRGLRRFRVVGGAAFGVGLISVLSLYISSTLGYTPDPMFVPLMKTLAPLGMALLILGAVLLTAEWVLHGFVPDAPKPRE